MLNPQLDTESRLKQSPSKFSKNCFDFSLEDGLTRVIQALKSEMDLTMTHLEECRGTSCTDEDAMVFIKMINTVELLQMHLEFTLEVLKSNSDEEITTLKKKKFSLISHQYEQIKSKEDVNQVPIKSVVAFMLDKMHTQLIDILESCFKKSTRGEIKMIKTTDNIAKVLILTFKFEVGASYYPLVVSFPKDDVFSFEKSSPVWQDLYQCATFKKFITKQEIYTSFKQVRLFLHIGYYVIKEYIENKQTLNLKTACSFFQDILYYGIQSDKVEIQALLYLMSPNIEHIFKAWHATDHPIILKAVGLRSPSVGHDQLIYVPRLFPVITKEVILKEYQDQTLNKICPIDMSQINVPDRETIESMRSEILEDIFIKTEDKIQIRILAPDRIKLQAPRTGNGRQGAGQDSHDSSREENLKGKGAQGQDQAIVIHIHGGGFVSMSSASHKVYLSRWVKNLKLTHFSIDYRLAPKDMYPSALDDVWQAYLWIVHYADAVLGIKTPKVILAGDSAGGNLCVVLALRLVKAGLSPPDGCFLIYPALLMDFGLVSPSYYNALEDPILHYNILRSCLKAYVGEEFDPAHDPFISPLRASDELIQGLPSIRIVTGSEDPLHDDSWRLVARLRKLKKDVKIVIHEHLGHGFMAHLDLKNYEMFIEEGCELIKDLITFEPK